MAPFLYILIVQLICTVQEVSMRTVNYSEARQNLAKCWIVRLPESPSPLRDAVINLRSSLAQKSLNVIRPPGWMMNLLTL